MEDLDVTFSTQTELFHKPLSDYTKNMILVSADQLFKWALSEAHPHVKAAVLEYYNQLRLLSEDKSIWIR